MNLTNPEIQVNSTRSSFSRELTSEEFQANINKEFDFFDKNYFKEKNAGLINLYYSGHGERDVI